jgi:site-specific recombinase XerD
MKLGTAIDDFLAYQADQRGLAVNTLRAYTSDLEKARTFLEQQAPRSIHDVTSYDLKEFIAHLRDDLGFKPRSIARIMSTLRVFFGHLVTQERMPRNPAAALHNPKNPQKLPVYLVDDEIVRLLRAPDRGDPVGARNHTILASFLFLGLRLSELCGLDVGALDLGAGMVRVMGKGSKERILPVHPFLEEVLAGYLRGPRRQFGTGSSPALFLTEDGNRMTPRMVGWVVHRAVQAAGVNARITPHKLRHTFATQLLHGGATLLDIRDLLGHANLSTTSIYTHTTVKRLERAVDRIDLG